MSSVRTTLRTAIRTGVHFRQPYVQAVRTDAHVRPVRTGQPSVRVVRQKSFARNACLPYVPYVRLVRMGQSYVRPIQRYQIIYLFTVDRHKLRHVHALCVSVSVCNKSNILHCRYVRLMRMDSRTYGLYVRLSKMNARTYGCTYGPFVRPVQNPTGGTPSNIST